VSLATSHVNCLSQIEASDRVEVMSTCMYVGMDSDGEREGGLTALSVIGKSCSEIAEDASGLFHRLR
jgi:hypothetical protein